MPESAKALGRRGEEVLDAGGRSSVVGNGFGAGLRGLEGLGGGDSIQSGFQRLWMGILDGRMASGTLNSDFWGLEWSPQCRNMDAEYSDQALPYGNRLSENAEDMCLYRNMQSENN